MRRSRLEWTCSRHVEVCTILQGQLKFGCAVQTSRTIVVVRFRWYSNALRVNLSLGPVPDLLIVMRALAPAILPLS